MRPASSPRVVLPLLLALASALPASGAATPATGTTADELITQQGSDADREFGDFVAADNGGGLDEPYRYYIEVPTGTTCLVVEIFDADIGTSEDNDDATGERDRDRGGFDSDVSYVLSNPSLTSVAASQYFTAGDDTGPVGADNHWMPLYGGGTTATYRDEFGAVNYGNNNGSASFTAAWTEVGDNANPASGSVLITGGQLRVSGATDHVHRNANLSTACTAVLTLDVVDVGDLEANDCADVSVSSNNGTSYTVLETFCDDTGALSRSYNISSFAAAQTRIRLRASTNLTAGSEAFAFDNVQIATRSGTPTSGHWRLEVDMSSPVTGGNDINAFGIRAHDRTSGSGGTELNVYAESYYGIGINDNDGGRGYTLYPYVTSGCEADFNSFDWDANSGGGSPPNPAPFGSWDVTSRSGTYSDDDGGTMSNNDAWSGAPTFTGWTSNSIAADYGIWELDVAIDTYSSASGNYGVFFLGSETAGNAPPAAQPVADSLRIYLPTDADAAPVKPFLIQGLSWVSGNNPPTQGNTSRFEVSVQIVNPTPYEIDFSSTTAGANVVTARVTSPASFVASSISTSQGPASHSGGTVTWAPGSVAAGQTEILTYEIDVTPPACGSPPCTYAVTGTPASNGTRAIYVDETCASETTACTGSRLTRATQTLGPLCQLSVATNAPTPVLVTSFDAFERGGGVVLEWRTAAEARTLYFDVYRRNGEQLVRVNEERILALLAAPQGGTYRLLDPGASPRDRGSYFLVETETNGERHVHGPFEAEVDWSRHEAAEAAAIPHPPTERFVERRAAAAATPPAQEKVTIGGPARAMAISTREPGLHRISADDVAAGMGTSPAQARNAIRDRRLRLTHRGQEVAWRASADALEFYAEGIDSPYTTDDVYRLHSASGLVFGQRSVAGADSVRPSSFAETIHFEKEVFAGTLLPLDPDGDFWLWDFVVAGMSKTFPVTLPGVASGAGDASVRLSLQGAFTVLHTAEVSVNGVVVGEVRLNGLAAGTATLDFDQGLLHEGANTIELRGTAGGPLVVDSLDVSYRRLYRAEDGRLLASAEGASAITVTGFATADVRVFDVSDPRRPLELLGPRVELGPDGYGVTFVPGAALRFLAIAGPGRAPDATRASKPSTLRKPSNRGEYTVIAPAALAAAAEGLIRHRGGHGFSTRLVELEGIYDEFNDGIADPHAIRDFLVYAAANWNDPPRFVALAGHGTYDYKDVQGFGANLVPPLMASDGASLYPTDARYADLVGDDGVPELAVGRIPVVSADELGDYVDKLSDYERGHAPTGSDRVMLLADDPDVAGDFPADGDRLAAEVPAGFAAEKVYLGPEGVSAAREQLFAGLADGVGLLHYLGHGGPGTLADEGLLTVDDVGALDNARRTPIVTAETCHVALSALPGFDSLGELLTVQPDGGAIAVWAPGWLSQHPDNRVLGQQVVQTLLHGGGEEVRLGDVVRDALARGAALGLPKRLLQTYQLLGDPALTVRLAPDDPHPGGGPGGSHGE